MENVQFISCANHAGFVMNFSVQWLAADGTWRTCDWNSGDYPMSETRTSPDLASIGVPGDALAVAPLVQAVLGTSVRGDTLVRYAPNAQTAAYDVTGTTLSFSVRLVPLTISNWSGTISYNPSGYFEPATTAALQQIVRQAHGDGAQVRPRGSGHSWNQAIATRGVSINTEHLDLEVAPSSVRVTVDGKPYVRVTAPASMRQGEFAELAQRLGAPLPTQGPALDITLSGFVANGCHGTGWDQPTIAELVYGIELVAPSGERLYFDQTIMPDSLRHLGIAAPDMMNLVRVNLGALGVLSRIVFQLPAEPFRVRVRHLFPKVTEVFDRNDPTKLQTLLDRYDWVEIFWFPYNSFSFFGGVARANGIAEDSLWVIAYERTTDPVSPNADKVNAWTDEIGALASMGTYIGATVALDSSLVPTLSAFAQLLTRYKYQYSDGVVLEPPDAFLYQKTYFPNFMDLEFTIPMKDGAGAGQVTAAFYQLVDRMEAWRTGTSGDSPYPVNLNVHARFIKNSQAALSPAHAQAGSSTHTCYIEYLSYSNGRLFEDYLKFNQEFYAPANQNGWKHYGGLPNWGKFLPSVPGIFRYVHDLLDTPPAGGTPSRLRQFLAIRDQIDPGGAMFTNPYLNGFFTGNAPPSLEEDLAHPMQSRPRAVPFIPVSASTTETERTLSIETHRPEPSMHADTARHRRLRLFHDLDAGAAWLVNDHGEVNVLEMGFDATARTITYRVVSPSQFLESNEILDRIEALHRPA